MAITRRTLLKRLAVSGLGAAASVGPLSVFGASGAARPDVIRIGVAQPATGTPPTFAGSSIAIAHARGWLEEAFKPSGTRIEWLFFKGAGPAVNEAISTNQLDFAMQGDLPAIVARAAGLKTRLVLATGVRTNIYIGVPPDSPLVETRLLRAYRAVCANSAQIARIRLVDDQGIA